MDFDWKFFWEVVRGAGKAVPLTLYLSLWSFFFGLLIALVIAILRYKKIFILDKFADFYVSFIRGTPVILQLYLVYYIIPAIVDNFMIKHGFSFRMNQIEIKKLVVLTLSINMSAYLAETIRGGLNSLGRSEIEAAMSIGMTGGQILRRIIIPQVLVISIPNFSSQLIGVIQATSLAFYVTLVEVTGTARIMAMDNWKYFEAYVATGLIYWLLTVAVEIVTFIIEKLVEKRGYALHTRRA